MLWGHAELLGDCARTRNTQQWELSSWQLPGERDREPPKAPRPAHLIC